MLRAGVRGTELGTGAPGSGGRALGRAASVLTARVQMQLCDTDVTCLGPSPHMCSGDSVSLSAAASAQHSWSCHSICPGHLSGRPGTSSSASLRSGWG